ncbi:DNA-3-methyladenine glycosylase 2 family protein [Aeromicrobium tamlense]|uniref:DNA-3-methyladenine glycosylase II n=1 Tax=Aeromicrobium tamlense TaxID=375541 RepID=A0A8I0FTV3_9ACTN|nr:AlkA N-terminal domain-containing protein [Aeromicrobium tamlense]MBD1268691.1 DNA-3-methyladenine glycosylase 2 family protein [Aeromicrobium tamlense]NYI37403.1 AraC family transcriptional regulator of adaptative response / DNA-3-methyladenine glycosylase II [Aeromicrobium tamlense]
MEPSDCYRAVSARDARFDGVFFTAVRTTGIYCRPSCPAVTPRQANVTFYPSAAAAERSGYRACRRCRPDSTPGSPEWNVRADVVARAVRMIGDGVVEREGVSGLADRLGYSERQVNRLVTTELGAGPQAIARSNRARTARILLETTTMRAADVAFAAGYGSVRQFNDSIRESFDLTPRELRARSRRSSHPGAGRIQLELALRPPFQGAALLDWFAPRAIEGVERVDGRTYARVLNLPHGVGAVELTLHDERVSAELELTDLRDLAPAVQRCRRLLDLDADPAAIDEALSADPLLARLVQEAPGMRLPGQVDGFEMVMRAIVGQQVSVAGARTILGRVARSRGTEVDLELAHRHGLTHAFATAESVAEAAPEEFAMPRGRAAAILAVAHAVASGDLDLHPGADRAAARERLLAVRGIGPWTADYVRMRALGDPDVLLDTDLVLRRVLAREGLDRTRTERWRPWRSYASLHLWRVA